MDIRFTHRKWIGYFCCLLFFSFNYNVPSQSRSLPFNGDMLLTDQFGNYYEIGAYEIKKFDKNSNWKYTYSSNINGKITSVDVSNPYKVLVYFRDFTRILILDNTLSPTTEVIDLIEAQLEEVTLVCSSYNGGIWYYNPLRFELIRKNQELITTNLSVNISNLLGKKIYPTFLLEYNNRLYLNDPKQGILVFDHYGTYLKTIPIFNLTTFQVKERFIVYVNSERQIEIYDFLTLEETIYRPEKYTSVRMVRVEDEYIYIINEKDELIIDEIRY